MTAAGLAILRAGTACTLQDRGRIGWLRHGVTSAGPMDWIAQDEANILAGNPPGTVAVEVGPGGVEVAARGAALRVGISAPGFRAMRDGLSLPARASVMLDPGQVLSLRSGDHGVWGYLAVQGGFAVAEVLGSRATHLRSGIGPMGALAAGDLVPAAGGQRHTEILLDPAPPADTTLRFVPGPQADAFAPGAMQAFAAAPWTVSPRSDRMAYRLSGPPLAHLAGHDIVSDGVVFGSIQVPGDGQPLVLMADRQPTGGYPKIGTVIRADLPRLAQTRAGDTVRFRPVAVEAAVAALRRAIPSADALIGRAGAQAGGPDLVRLASGDFASGFIDGR